MNDRPDQSLATRRKRLRFQAWHRGVKEADLVLGRFVDRNGGNFDAEECDFFEKLLEQPDQDILDWLTGKAPVPEAFEHPLMQKLQKLEHVKP
jgi:antitoxin CptB